MEGWEDRWENRDCKMTQMYLCFVMTTVVKGGDCLVHTDLSLSLFPPTSSQTCP